MSPIYRIKPAKAKTQKRQKRRFNSATVGHKELAMLQAGAPLDKVLLSFFGGCVDGARWQHIVAKMMECGELSTGEVHAFPIRHNDRTERVTLAWVIEVLSSIRRKGARLVAQRKELFQRTMGWRLGVSVSAIQRRTRVAKLAGVFRPIQPPADSQDALMPRVGDWSYNEYVPCSALPPALLHRLRIAWGEVRPTEVPSSPPAPAPALSPVVASSGAPRAGAPPPEDLSDTNAFAAMVLEDLKRRAAQKAEKPRS